MKSFYPSLKIFTLIIPAFMWSCFGDAPRNNPLDPENPNSNLSDLNGQVLTNRVPHQPISNIKVTWRDNRFVYSDENGFFNFFEIKKENGWLIFESNNYLTDSLFVNWTNFKPGLEKFLNAAPLLQNVVFYSSIENDYPDRQVISLNFKVEIDDPDNDIDSVLLKSASLDVNTFLGYNLEQKIFEKKLTMADLNINSSEAVIGQEFSISVKDNFSNIIPITTEIVKRIIKEEVIPVIFEGDDTLSVTPTFKWSAIDPGFPFEYMFEIYYDEKPNARLIYRKEKIPSIPFTERSITLDFPLVENKDYYWIVWVVDEFQNRSASKPKSFYAR